MKTITLIKSLLLAIWGFVFFECVAQWEYMEPIPTPRTQATASTLNGKIYVIGGVTEEDGQALQTVEVYDPKTNTWNTTTEEYPMPISDASCQVVNGVLYVFGGRNREGGPISFYKNVYAFDENANTWTKKADLPFANYLHRTVVVRDTIFIIGGVENWTATPKVYAYVPDQDRFIRKKDLPMPRAMHTVQAIGNDIYVIGGAYSHAARNTVFRYQLASQKWESVASLPEPLVFHGSAKLDNQIYVFGGLTNFNGTTSQKTLKLQIEPDTIYWVDTELDMPEDVIGYAHSVVADETGRLATYMFSGATKAFYNPDGNPTLSPNTRKFVPKLNEQWKYMSPIPTPRSHATASTLNGKIYVIGGATEEEGPALQTVEAFDPITNSWDTTIADYPLPISGASSQVANGVLYVFGGRDHEGGPFHFYNSVYAYDDERNTWIQKTGLPTPNYFHKTVVVGDTIFIIGGVDNLSASQRVYAYIPDQDTFILQKDLPMPRAIQTVQAIDRKIYAIGGAYLLEVQNAVFRYQIASQKWESVASLPEPLAFHGSAKLDNEIYVFGGATNFNGTTSQKTWKLQIEPDTMYWVDTGVDMPEEVIGYAHAVATDETGRLATYMFSGATKAFYNPDGSHTLSPSTRKFSLEKNTSWKYMSPMPTPRALTATAVLDGKIYVIGGVFSRNGMATNIVEAYDIESNTWQTDIAPLPEPRCHATADAIFSDYDPETGAHIGKVYVVGGSEFYLGPGKNTTYVYDPKINVWTRKSDVGIAFTSHMSTNSFSRLYIMGGIDESGMATNTAYKYNAGQDNWEVFHPLNHARAFGKAVTLFFEVSSMFVTGGLYLNELVPQMEISAGLDGPWFVEGDIHRERYWHGSGMIGLDTIVVYGGIGEDNQPLFDIAKYNWKTDEWFTIDEVLPEYSSPFASLVIREGNQVCLYAIGGPTYDFWSSGNGPMVSGLNLKYCMDAETTTYTNNAPESTDNVFQNYPNPVQDHTIIPFELYQPGHISLEIVNLNGQKMATIFSGYLDSGMHSIPFYALNIPNGVYLYQLKTEEGIAVKKLIVQHPE